MTFNSELAVSSKNFWYEFDKALNPPMPPANTITKQQVRQILGPKSIIRPIVDNFNWQSQTLNSAKFKEDVIKLDANEIIIKIADEQLRLINQIRSLGGPEIVQTAFEYFGQGVLYDAEHDVERTAPAETGKLEVFRIHMADSISVYGIWHAFIRALNVIEPDENTWLEIDKLVSLAYLIHSKIMPIQSFLFNGGPEPENAPEMQKPDWEGIDLVLEQSRGKVQFESFEEADRILVMAFNGPFPFS